MWKKGQSGNPGGRSKEAVQASRLAREHGARAIERLAEWMESENPKASVAACAVLLDRGFGKARQSVTKTVTHVKRSPRDLTLEELEKRLQEMTGAVQ